MEFKENLVETKVLWMVKVLVIDIVIVERSKKTLQVIIGEK